MYTGLIDLSSEIHRKAAVGLDFRDAPAARLRRPTPEQVDLQLGAEANLDLPSGLPGFQAGLEPARALHFARADAPAPSIIRATVSNWFLAKPSFRPRVGLPSLEAIRLEFVRGRRMSAASLKLGCNHGPSRYKLS
jgi:hypothetical protein